MFSLLFSVAWLGQAESGVPPAPAAEIPVGAAISKSEEMRSWLLARLVIDSAFDEKKSAEASRLLANMNESQLTALVNAYNERTAKTARVTPSLQSGSPPTASQQATLDQAKLNLQQAEAYRDHLKREYDRRLLQGQMTQNLVYQNIVNNQMLMYRTNGAFTYGAFGVGPIGFGGLSYGALNYGGWGFGAPLYGGAYFGVPGAW